MFAVIRNPAHVTGTTYVGKVESRHRTAKAAIRAKHEANRGCRKVNGPNTWLDLEVGEIEHDDRDANVARIDCGTEAVYAALETFTA